MTSLIAITKAITASAVELKAVKIKHTLHDSRALPRCVLRVNTNLFLSGKNNYDKQGFDSFLHGREKTSI